MAHGPLGPARNVSCFITSEPRRAPASIGSSRPASYAFARSQPAYVRVHSRESRIDDHGSYSARERRLPRVPCISGPAAERKRSRQPRVLAWRQRPAEASAWEHLYRCARSFLLPLQTGWLGAAHRRVMTRSLGHPCKWNEEKRRSLEHLRCTPVSLQSREFFYRSSRRSMHPIAGCARYAALMPGAGTANHADTFAQPNLTRTTRVRRTQQS